MCLGGDLPHRAVAKQIKDGLHLNIQAGLGVADRDDKALRKISPHFGAILDFPAAKSIAPGLRKAFIAG